jgi:hypothetical protein
VKIKDTSAPSVSWSGKANTDIAKRIGVMLWQCEVTVFTQADFCVRRFADTYTDNGEYRNAVSVSVSVSEEV